MNIFFTTARWILDIRQFFEATCFALLNLFISSKFFLVKAQKGIIHLSVCTPYLLTLKETFDFVNMDLAVEAQKDTEPARYTCDDKAQSVLYTEGSRRK